AVVERVTPIVHVGDARRNRGEGAHDRHEARDHDRERTPPLEEHVGADDVLPREQSALLLLEDARSGFVADEVADLAAEERGYGDGDAHPPDRDLDAGARLGHRAGEAQQPGDDEQGVARRDEADQQPGLGEHDEAHHEQCPRAGVHDDLVRVEPWDQTHGSGGDEREGGGGERHAEISWYVGRGCDRRSGGAFSVAAGESSYLGVGPRIAVGRTHRAGGGARPHRPATCGHAAGGASGGVGPPNGSRARPDSTMCARPRGAHTSCGRRGSNPHAVRHRNLNPACLPFHHSRGPQQSMARVAAPRPDSPPKCDTAAHHMSEGYVVLRVRANGEIMRRILIIGGGYAGFYTAWQLEKKLRPDEAEITIVEPRSYMTYQPFLPEVVAGSVEARHVAISLRSNLRRTTIVPGRVTSITHADKHVQVEMPDGPPRTLEYDIIVVTAGAVTRTFPIEGLAENAIGLKTVEEA